MAGKGGVHRLAEPMVHSCGFESWYPTGYAMHAKHCDGTKPATEGRIAARQRETAVAIAPARRIGRPRKAAPDVATERRREQYRAAKQRSHGTGHPEPATPGIASIAAAATDKAVEVALVGLRAKREQLTVAILALEALS